MQAGLHNTVNKTNLVLHAAKDLEFSLEVKRKRRLQGIGKGYRVFGCIESIVFESSDRNFTGTRADMLTGGRRLYWPENGPYIARTIPEEDLIFPSPWRLPLPKIADARDDSKRNPYEIDQHGAKHLPEGKLPHGPRMIAQKLEDIASSKYRNFLIFQPVAQIICFIAGHDADGPTPQFGFVGNHRMPISSYSDASGRKLALLVDPYTGEAFFSGGNYSVDVKESPMKSIEEIKDIHAGARGR